MREFSYPFQLKCVLQSDETPRIATLFPLTAIEKFHRKMVCELFKQIFKDLWAPTDIYASMRPLMLLNFISGMSAFKVVHREGNKYLQLTYLGFVNTVVHVVLFFLSYVMRVTSTQTFIGYFFNSKISKFTNDIQNLTQSVALLVSLISCFLKRNKFRSLMHSVAIIDKKLIRLGVTIDYKAISRVTTCLIVMKFLSYAILMGAGYMLLEAAGVPDVAVWILFFLPHLIVSNLKITFIFILSQVSNRFRYISHVLNRLRQRHQKVEFLPMRGSMDEIRMSKITGMTHFEQNFVLAENHIIISELCKTHEALCDACYLAEEYFSHQMMTIIAIDFMVIVFCSYNIVDAIYNENQLINVHPTGFILFFAYYMLLTFVTIYGIVRAAGRVTQEVMRSVGGSGACC